MRIVRTFVMAPFMVLGAGVALAGESAVTLGIEGMVCGPDPHIIRQSLRALPGIRDITISLENKTASVSFDDAQTSVDAMLRAVATAGYASHQVK